MNKDAQMKATINQKLIETGERERYVGFILYSSCTEYGLCGQFH